MPQHNTKQYINCTIMVTNSAHKCHLWISTRHFWTPGCCDVFEQESGTAVLCGQILSSKRKMPDLQFQDEKLFKTYLQCQLQCLQLATVTDSLQTTHCWICDLQIVYVQWPKSTIAFYLYFLFIISIHMTRIKKDLPVDLIHESWWWLLAKIVKVRFWHDQSNQSYCTYNVIWRNFCGQWPWAFLEGNF
jgi:hypothetical protein